MSDQKILTREIAEKLLADRRYVKMSVVWGHEFTTIEDEAAESLGKHEGELNLRGLTNLSDAAAESLSRHKGILGLAGLTELSDAAAQILRDAGHGHDGDE